MIESDFFKTKGKAGEKEIVGKERSGMLEEKARKAEHGKPSGEFFVGEMERGRISK